MLRPALMVVGLRCVRSMRGLTVKGEAEAYNQLTRLWPRDCEDPVRQMEQMDGWTGGGCCCKAKVTQEVERGLTNFDVVRKQELMVE